jgi:hypothetical protein
MGDVKKIGDSAMPRSVSTFRATAHQENKTCWNTWNYAGSVLVVKGASSPGAFHAL